MKLKNVMVSGIDRIVFVNQGVMWKRINSILDGEPPYWVKCVDGKVGEDRYHDWAVKTIKHFSEREDAYVWISGDTVNIKYPLSNEVAGVK